MCVCVQFAGRWYRVGLAYDSEKFVPFRNKLKASMGLVSVLPDGNVNLTMWDATWVPKPRVPTEKGSSGEKKQKTLLRSNKLSVSSVCFRPFGCLVKTYQYEKTNVAGQFNYFSTRELGHVTHQVPTREEKQQRVIIVISWLNIWCALTDDDREMIAAYSCSNILTGT